MGETASNFEQNGLIVRGLMGQVCYQVTPIIVAQGQAPQAERSERGEEFRVRTRPVWVWLKETSGQLHVGDTQRFDVRHRGE